MLKMIASTLLGIGIPLLFFFYLRRRLIVDTRLSPTWRKRATWLLSILFIGTFTSLLASRLISPMIAKTIGWPFFVWMGMTLLLTTFLLIRDVLDLLVNIPRRMFRGNTTTPDDEGRRAFFHQITGGGVAAAAVAVTGQGTLKAVKGPGIVDVPIFLKRFPPCPDGFTLVQLTDIHIGFTIGRDFAEDIVTRTNALKPDLIVITGDMVDGTVEDLKDAIAPFAELSASQGVYFVTGNHEYYAGADEWIAHITSLGIRVLRNERVAIETGYGDFDLAGVDDYNAGTFPGHGPNLAKAVFGRDVEKELIVLAHQPRQIHESVKHNAGLQLSGHTHGGQIWPWHYLAMAQQEGMLAGEFRFGETQLYVSRGTGYWGPPVRVFAPAEITRVIIRRTRY